ncbi:ligase-associated DNA damage response DEXH box helicase [Arvimicrobium flavum]|uniref:ligase-associated DNA damage response DEXH box helicase n=1 Tax=Arvimicrobium flavum TaxID=3393320 RepID=UPI00237A734F|nr:ligase-associated DNA damage response DEXH box helicase [Mesorhizobium shangrilense]
MTHQTAIEAAGSPASLPEPFVEWFARRGWSPRAHQLDLLAKAQAGHSVLLIAPTGAGKTLAGFLPSLTELSARPRRKPGEAHRGVHTLYISPLKALAVDIERNLGKPVAEMALPISMETRTGDTPAHKRQRQKLVPPDLLLTTPEQLALLVASPDARRFFQDLRYVVLDELHSLVTSKRGHLLALGLARLRRVVPDLQTIGLSATVAEPEELRRWLVPQVGEANSSVGADTAPMADLITVSGGARPDITILDSEEHVPWAGHSARYAIPDIYEAIKRHRTTLLFVNTRSQAEMLFQELWRVNDDSLPIALHHGSLDVAQRRRVEKAMETNSLRAIVATSTLDLGIDWGDVDLVVHVGAPKGASRLAQRIGRANHRLDEPSRAILVPANRFEVLECRAALEANYLGAQDTPPLVNGALDVLSQHVLGTACAEPFDEDELFEEIRTAAPYAALDRDTFARVVDFVATGGYALKSYERYARIRKTKEGKWRIAHPRVAQQYRLNVGTIVEAPYLTVRYARAGRGVASRGGPVLGKIEEGFMETIAPGDTFLFAGKVLRLEGIRETEAFVSNAAGNDPRIPIYNGGKFPLSTYLAEQVRGMLADPARWQSLPEQVADWLRIQRDKSLLPPRDTLLVETFPRGDRSYMVAYPFEGRLAHQTLGMLLTRRLDRLGADPLGFVATDYSIAVWSIRDMSAMFREGRPTLAELFDEDMLGDDLDAWLAESWLLKRTFRNCAVISGLIEKRYPGQEKTGRQMTVSADLIYDVLRTHEPDHILLQATRADAAAGLLDVRRLGEMLSRIRGRIIHKDLDQISPLAVPIMLEIGKERVHGDAGESLLTEAADLVEEAMGRS